MFFGGSLTGAKPLHGSGGRVSGPETSATKPTPSSVNEIVTPHTDVLHRLTNHELRLLEELERTRSKLQSEWKLKLTDLQRDEPEAAQALFQRGVPTVDQLTKLFLVSKSSTSRPNSAANTAGGAIQDSDLQRAMQTRTMALTNNQRSKAFLPHKKGRATAAAAISGAGADPVQPKRGSLNRQPSLPTLRMSLDVLPVLTTAAETAFEVGLEGEGGEATASPQHVLPIFSLPTVNVHATATAMAVKQVEVVTEDRDRKQASETLGLSLDEIEMLEAELNGHPIAPKAVQGSKPSNQAVVVLTAKLPGLHSSHISKKNKHKGSNSSSMKKHADGSHRKKASTAKGKAGHSDIQSGDLLRKELETALHSVQHLTRLVKEDIYSAQKICPASELRTSLYFKRWGKDKVENIFRRLLFNMQGIAFARWKQVVAHEKQQEKLQAYLMYKGSKKLDEFFLTWTNRKLRQAWAKWYGDVVAAKSLERGALELDSIRVIQRAFRGYRGRMFARLIKMQKQFARETDAAHKIQRLFRGSIVRKFFRLKQLHKKRQAAATKIQCLARGYLARRTFKQRFVERRRHLAASRIQALQRGHKARRQVSQRKRQQRVTQAAVLIQRRYRGRLGRAKYMKQQIMRHRNKAATTIQKIARGFHSRKLLVRLQEAKRNLLLLQNAMATKIQKVYRGHRSRLGTQLKLIALKEKNKLRRKSAIKIQSVVRRRQARHTVAKMKGDRLANMVALARLWVEYWSEDTSQWFYFNTQTSEAIWAPPVTGYTKADGLLVLQSGKIIENPLDGMLGDPALAFPTRKQAGDTDNTASHTAEGGAAHDHDHGHPHDREEHGQEDEDADRLCVECEEEDALRKCDQCEDVYCDACYQKLHSSAKREKHTWKAIGTMRCIECEKMKATRWCAECQDPYCLGCFTIIHSKGNKSTHQWTDMAAFRKQKKQREAQQQQQQATSMQVSAEEDGQTYDEYMRSADYQYVSELATEEAYPYPYQQDPYAPTSSTTTSDPYYSQAYGYPSGGGAASVASSNTAEEWTTQFDENSGQYYYYNVTTGETRWA